MVDLRVRAICLARATWGGQQWRRGDVIYQDSRPEPDDQAWAVLPEGHRLVGRLILIEGGGGEQLVYRLEYTSRFFELTVLADGGMELGEIAGPPRPQELPFDNLVAATAYSGFVRWGVCRPTPAPPPQEPDWLGRGLR